jgi:spore coat protein U-like protein
MLPSPRWVRPQGNRDDPLAAGATIMIQQLLRVSSSIIVLSNLNLGMGVEGLAAAETASTSMEVSLHVTPHCTVSAEPLAFGSVTVAEAPARGAASSIEVACTEKYAVRGING